MVSFIYKAFGNTLKQNAKSKSSQGSFYQQQQPQVNQINNQTANMKFSMSENFKG